VAQTDVLHEAPEEAGEGERATEEDRHRASCGHQHSQGGVLGELLSSARRRAAVKRVYEKIRVSERQACRG
jgi:hypothetical protein